MHVRIAPLPGAFLARVRTAGLDDLGQPVRRLRAEGGEPCRDVLRRARAGEALLLASFCPFALAGPYREYGPVFVLANASAEPVARDRLPRADGSAEAYVRDRLALRAYGPDESILDAALVGAGALGDEAARLLARPDVAFVHARFPVYGCFACRIERAT